MNIEEMKQLIEKAFAEEELKKGAIRTCEEDS